MLLHFSSSKFMIRQIKDYSCLIYKVGEGHIEAAVTGGGSGYVWDIGFSRTCVCITG